MAEISTSNGATTCPTDIIGTDGSPATWNAATNTCTLVGNKQFLVTLCISSTASGCSKVAMDTLLIDSGVTLQLVNDSGIGVYSNVENHGTINAIGIDDYGRILNYGTLIGRNDINTLPENGFGTVTNEKGAGLDAKYLSNSGLINNYGAVQESVYQDGICCYLNGTTIFGDLSNIIPLVGGSGSTGLLNLSMPQAVPPVTFSAVNVSISGSSGSNANVSFRVYGDVQPLGSGLVSLSSSTFFDISVTGIVDGNAVICLSGTGITSTYVMQYWNGAAWVNFNSQVFQSPNTTCGSAPVSALGGTPIAHGKPVLKTKPSATSASVARGHSASTTLTISGFSQSVTLSHGTLPTGVSIKFAQNPTKASSPGTKDLITFSVSSAARVGTYKITITATGANKQKSIITFTLKIT